jgi:hypothetical protein
LIKDGPIQHIRHYLIDFGAALGSDSFTAKSPRAGNEYLFAWKPSAIEFFTLGLHVPRWARADYPKIRGVGRFEWKIFDPEKWVPNYPNPAFMNCLPEDAYWAAKQVARFTDEEIRALVETGAFEDPKAVEWLTRALIERRDKIVRAYLGKVLPLENFQIVDGAGSSKILDFEDLEVKYGLQPKREYSMRWSRFDNETEQKIPLQGESGKQLPGELLQAKPGSYYAVEIHCGVIGKLVSAYLRKSAGGQVEVVGIDRESRQSDRTLAAAQP